MINNLEKLKEFPFSNPRNFKEEDYYYPIIYSLITSSTGISFSRKEIKELVSKNLNISDEILDQPVSEKNPESKLVGNRIDFALYFLYLFDYLDREKKKGQSIYTFSLSSLGKQVTNEKTLIKDIKKKKSEYNKQKAINENKVDDCTTSDASSIKKVNNLPDKNFDIDANKIDETNINNWKKRMLADLHSLSYTGFEKFCVEFLEAMGVKDIEHTGKSCDKGIDIEGEIEINFFIKYKVVVQCKRYALGNNVSSDEIMKLKGSMAHTNAQKAVFITTSNYTKEALKSAKSNNKDQHIELINGNDLCDYIVKYMSDTYVETNYVYNLNEKELEKFKD